MTDTQEYGPAAQVRRLVIDAAASKLAASRVPERHQAIGQMFAYTKVLKLMAELGIADEGTAPGHGSSGDNIATLQELCRFLGSASHAQDLGFSIREGLT